MERIPPLLLRPAGARHPDSSLQDSLNGVRSCALWKIAAEWNEQRERERETGRSPRKEKQHYQGGRERGEERSVSHKRARRRAFLPGLTLFDGKRSEPRGQGARRRGGRGGEGRQRPQCKRGYGPHRAETRRSFLPSRFHRKGFFCLGKDIFLLDRGDTCARPFSEE